MRDSDLVARLDPAFGLANVFLSLPRTGRRRKLDVACEFGGTTIRWRGPDQMSIADQSVLFALVALAGARPAIGNGDAMGTLPVALRAGLDVQGNIADVPAMHVLTSWYELARLCGHADRSGRTLDQMRVSVARLTETTVWVSRHGVSYSTRLVARAALDGEGVAVALNPRLAEAVGGGQYARIALSERNALHGDVARALHAYFCVSIRPGRSFKYRLASLEPRVWADLAAGATRRTRRRRLWLALKEIESLIGWSVMKQGDTYIVSRPVGRIVKLETLYREIGNATSGNRKQPTPPKPSTGAALLAAAGPLQSPTRTYKGHRRPRGRAPATVLITTPAPAGGGEEVPASC